MSNNNESSSQNINSVNNNGDKDKTTLQFMDIKSVTESLDKLQEGIDKGVQKGSYNLAETNAYLKAITYLSKTIEHLDSLQKNALVKAVEQVSISQLQSQKK